MRSHAREAAFKIIFAGLFGTETDQKFRSVVYKKDKLNEEDSAFAERLYCLTDSHRDELLALLSERVERFAQYRIYTADKAIMLVALAEIMYADDVPPVVSVSEAAALARKYSTENSAGFVNGVLAGVINHDDH